MNRIFLVFYKGYPIAGIAFSTIAISPTATLNNYAKEYGFPREHLTYDIINALPEQLIKYGE